VNRHKKIRLFLGCFISPDCEILAGQMTMNSHRKCLAKSFLNTKVL